MIHRSLLRCTRGERVPLSLYERTFVAVLHFHSMTAYYDCIPQPAGKSRRFLPFPNNHRRQSKVLCFSIFTTQPSISSHSQCPTDHVSRRFRCQCRVNIYYSSEKLLKRGYIFVCTKINVYKIFFVDIYMFIFLFSSILYCSYLSILEKVCIKKKKFVHAAGYRTNNMHLFVWIQPA